MACAGATSAVLPITAEVAGALLISLARPERLEAAPLAVDSAATHMHDPMAGMDMSEHAQYHAMPALDGSYAATREASGTAWQPESARHEGLHAMSGEWMVMLHGFANLIYDHQGGNRGDHDLMSTNMLMGMAEHPLGAGRLGFRAMLSAEPATIGKQGYPLLLQTGETADGVTPLRDRQHPHDLFMELATTVSVADATHSVFLYAGLPGEPALGPPVYMHRSSGDAFPETPIAHHVLDSTHITFGVITLGAIAGRFKLEGSAFRGREPDQNRWNIESPKLDSHSIRASFNPTSDWALQASAGHLESPEQLEPGVNQDRVTPSEIYHHAWEGADWAWTLAWGENHNRPGRTLDAWLLESTLVLNERHTAFARIERVEKDELLSRGEFVFTRIQMDSLLIDSLVFVPNPAGAFTVASLSAGYAYDFLTLEHASLGLGGLGSVALLPHDLRRFYGVSPLSAMIYLRARPR